MIESKGASRSFSALLLMIFSPLCSIPAHASDASIQGAAEGGVIVLTASGGRFAGAISSLTYRGVQYIDIADHGRQMQSAIQLDGLGECLNPNEAGSRADGTAQTSTSVLEFISSANNVLATRTKPAFWLSPNENYQKPCNPALPSPRNTISYAQNSVAVSNYILNRSSRFYGVAIPNLLEVDVSWTVPENRQSSNTEASTGYLPSSFSSFLTYDRASRTLTKVTATATDSASQHTALPVIIARPNGLHAMGAFSPAIMTVPGRGYMAYLNFNTGANPSTKWSCVFGETNINAGSVYSYSCPIAVGTVDEVISAIEAYPVAGQAVSSMIPVYRFYKNPHHFITRSYSEAASASYAFETTGFHAFATGGTGFNALYRCFNSSNGDHFVSTQSGCEGKSSEGLLGFAASGASTGLVPLYRFYKASASDHLTTVNYNEGAQGGYSFEGVLGYVAY